MYILITYDVNTEEHSGRRRLQRVAKLCKNYGVRVQNSVFECVITEVQLIDLQNQLSNVIDTAKDGIRIYYLNKNDNRRIITIGVNNAINVEGSLIL